MLKEWKFSQNSLCYPLRMAEPDSFECIFLLNQKEITISNYKESLKSMAYPLQSVERVESQFCVIEP